MKEREPRLIKDIVDDKVLARLDMDFRKRVEREARPGETWSRRHFGCVMRTSSGTGKRVPRAQGMTICKRHCVAWGKASSATTPGKGRVGKMARRTCESRRPMTCRPISLYRRSTM